MSTLRDRQFIAWLIGEKYRSGMKVNSDKQLKLGRKVRREYGSWGAVLKNSYVREDGIRVVRPRAAKPASDPKMVPTKRRWLFWLPRCRRIAN